MLKAKYLSNLEFREIYLDKVFIDENNDADFEKCKGLDRIRRKGDYDIFVINNPFIDTVRKNYVYTTFECLIRPKKDPKWYYSLIIRLRFTYDRDAIDEKDKARYIYDNYNAEVRYNINKIKETGLIKALIEHSIRNIEAIEEKEKE